MRQTDEVQAKVRSIGLAVVFALAVAFLYLVYQATQFQDLTDISALDYAQVARNFARGEGFTTDFIRPLMLGELAKPSIDSSPEVAMAPLHPGLMGVFFKVFGATGRAAAWCCGLWFMLTCAVTYLLALKVFNRAVAVLATIIVATDAALLRYAVSGLETSLLTLLVTLLFAVLYFHWESDRARLGLSAAAGLLVGLIYLTDYPWIALFIPVLIVVWANSRGKGAAANAIAFIALCVIVTAPWTIRNYTLTGRLLPYRCTEAAMGTLSYPANTLYRSFAPPEFNGVIKYAASAPREMYSKLRSNLMQMLPMVAGLGGLFVGAFFWVAILVPFGGDGFSRARYVLYGTLLLLIVTLSVLGITGRSLAPFGPVAVVTAIALFTSLLDRRVARMEGRAQGRWRNFGIALLLIVHLAPLTLTMVPGFGSDFNQGTQLQRSADELNTLLPEGGPVITDMPWAVAWYADRPAIWLPYRTLDVRRMEEKVGRVNYMLLTPYVFQIRDAEKATGWARAWQQGLGSDAQYDTWVLDKRLANSGWVLFKHTL